MYPGMNKVLQAAGRVIRRTRIRIILLIDERFGTIKYRRLYPKEWSHYKRVGILNGLETNLRILEGLGIYYTIELIKR